MKSLHLFVMTCLLILTASVSAVEQITYYHSDASGSPIAATDDTGSLLWNQAYDAWGVPIPSASGDPRGFTGVSRDSDTGLSDLQARWYSPELGRMLAMDPVSFHEDNIQSFNLYAYGNNNPYRYVDPNGESPIEVFTELFPAAGRSYAALAAYGVGLATGDVYLQNTAMEAMGEMRTENLMSIASIYMPPGTGSSVKAAKYGSKLTKEGTRKLPFADKDRVDEINKTLDRIEGNGPYPHKRDGIVFKNKEGKLPDGNYKEYTVDTPGASNRGARRIVQDQNSGKTYYTDDHYQTFTQIDPKKHL